MNYKKTKCFVVSISFALLICIGITGCGGAMGVFSLSGESESGGSGGVVVQSEGGSSTIQTGSSNIFTDESFQVTFSSAVRISTVTSDTLFIVPVGVSANHTTMKSYDTSVCNPSNGIEATIECASDYKTCTVTPGDDIDQCYQYALCISPAIQYEDGSYFIGDIITFNTICCNTLFAGPCTFVPNEESISDDTTFSYEDIQIIVQYLGGGESVSFCFCKSAYQASENGCMSYSTIEENVDTCDLNTNGGDGGEGGGEEGEGGGGGDGGDRRLVHILGCTDCPSAEGQAYTVPDIASGTSIFKLEADYRADAGEDFSNLSYMLMAIEEERTCNGDCWGTVAGLEHCDGVDSCYRSVTGEMIGDFLTQRGKLDEYNANLCVDVWWEWGASGIDPNIVAAGSISSDILHLRIQKSGGICN